MWNTSDWEVPASGWSQPTMGTTESESFLRVAGHSLPRERFGHSTSKVPPAWEPALELRGYPFRVWIQDLDVWAAGTELAPELQAPAVVQRLGGAARDLVRAVPTTELRKGRTDALTGAIESGLTLLVRGSTRRFGQFAVETSTRCIIDLLGFRRRGSEKRR